MMFLKIWRPPFVALDGEENISGVIVAHTHHTHRYTHWPSMCGEIRLCCFSVSGLKVFLLCTLFVFCMCACLHACVWRLRSNYESHYCCHSKADEWTSQQHDTGQVTWRTDRQTVTSPGQLPSFQPIEKKGVTWRRRSRCRLTGESFDTAPSCGGAISNILSSDGLKDETGGRRRSRNSESQRTNVDKINGRLFFKHFYCWEDKIHTDDDLRLRQSVREINCQLQWLKLSPFLAFLVGSKRCKALLVVLEENELDVFLASEAHRRQSTQYIMLLKWISPKARQVHRKVFCSSFILPSALITTDP